MRILYFILDDQSRSKVQALAEARRLPVRQDGPWVIFEAVWDPDPVLWVLNAAGFPVPALEVVPRPKGVAVRLPSPG